MKLQLEKNLDEIYQQLSELGIKNFKIYHGKLTNEIMLDIKTSNNSNLIKTIDDLKNNSDIKSIYLSSRERRKLIYGLPVIYEKIGRFTFQISPDTPEEISSSDREKLENIKKIADVEIGDNILILYCGVGIIPIYLSTLAKSVVGIDPDPIAIRDANDNTRVNKIKNVKFICKDPRSVDLNIYCDSILIINANTLTKKIVKNIKSVKFKRIIYTN